MFPSPSGIVLVKFLQRQFIFIKGSDLFRRQDLCIDERTFIRFEYKRITGLNAHRLFKIIQCYNTESFSPRLYPRSAKIVCFMSRRQKSSPSTESMNASGVLGCDIPFSDSTGRPRHWRKLQPGYPLYLPDYTRTGLFPRLPKHLFWDWENWRSFRWQTKKRISAPAYIRGPVSLSGGSFANRMFCTHTLCFSFSLLTVFLSRALAEERSPLLLLLPAGEKSPVAHYCLVVP